MKGIDCHCHIFNIVSVGLHAILQQIQDTSVMFRNIREERIPPNLGRESAKFYEKLVST
ncbi:MAG TPA: hypothetical protein VFE66_06350 [Bacteroidales bacterium]|nr:hypothetical protein [Bacteroidales bacterium]